MIKIKAQHKSYSWVLELQIYSCLMRVRSLRRSLESNTPPRECGKSLVDDM